ncbi:MAG: prephenate dehydrogenase/arogenate dehydrogenase family protein [Candidatus Omnitrophica bacterium]|nr:prephenate dehydrogenase/arogenate dehydrogenase family protein [Candidatus Omnitrophota bacterium]
MSNSFAIVSLGLLGGSLAAAIRKRFKSAKIVAISRSPQKIAFAKKKRWIDQGFTTLSAKALRNVGFVLVCSPVDVIPRHVRETDRFAKPGTIVTDVGSTKSEIVRWVDGRKFKNIKFVGSHPLAGSHLTGARHARADLFEGAFVFMTPTRKSHREAVRSVSSFWKKLGAQVRIFSPEAHDQTVSQISHLPHAVASILMHASSPKPLGYAATGFSDTTRVAQGDPKLWAPIFFTNRAHLIRDLSRFEKILRQLTFFLKRRSKSSIHKFLETASQRRRKIG